MNDNLKFWESVQETDPRMTKKSVVSGQERTSIDAQYKKKMITKAFGMYGMGWGVDPRSEVFERQTYDTTTILHYRAIAFYVLDGNRYEFSIAASIKEAYITKNGNGYFKVDDEAVKKVRTDALTKGFTDLGFCADIHMGKFEDDNYITAQLAKRQLEEEENTEEARKLAEQDIAEWVKKERESAEKVLPRNERAYIALMNKIKDKLTVRCRAVGINPTKYVNRLEEIKHETLAKHQESGEQDAS